MGGILGYFAMVVLPLLRVRRIDRGGSLGLGKLAIPPLGAPQVRVSSPPPPKAGRLLVSTQPLKRGDRAGDPPVLAVNDPCQLDIRERLGPQPRATRDAIIQVADAQSRVQALR